MKSSAWSAEKLSKQYISDYKFPTTVDGEGIRGSIYVSGCLFNCEGCYNKKVQNFKNGMPYSDAIQEQILADMEKPFVDGITLLGGEPFLNTQVLTPLVEEVKRLGKSVWAWTGYTWEELMDSATTRDKLHLLQQVDVLVDGRFDKTKYNNKLVFRGSWNQRIIDVPASLTKKDLVLWRNGEYLLNELREPMKVHTVGE
jgi:anaerobic ribonucleoside-triphosphate reductase activating protein